MYGGLAFVTDANGRNLGEAKANHYGGFVCSRECDFKAALELERSMPGHKYSQRSPNCYSSEFLDRKWKAAP
jgi:hypothetical protein